MKVEEAIGLAAVGIAALVVIGVLMNRSKAPAGSPAAPSTPPPSNAVVNPPSQPVSTQSCLW